MVRHVFSAAAICMAGLPTLAGAEPLTTSQIETLFADATIVAGPDIVDCTLSGGTQSTCFQITVSPVPTTYEAGPWCPTSIDDGPEAAGIWFYEGEAVDADGEFFSKLAALYDDENWQVFDPDTGEVFYTATQEGCELAARPNVAEEYQNHCVQCLLEYYPDTVVTYTIPVEPVAADNTTDISRTGAGIAFNGIRLDGPAPVEAILSAYTIAAFDDCGGHVNPHVGYHYHAVTDCLTESIAEAHDHGDVSHTHASDTHATVVGIAMDGHLIASHLNADGTAPDDLDSCYGHTSDDLGYHYHAGATGTNQNLGCLTAQTGCFAEGSGETCDATARRSRP